MDDKDKTIESMRTTVYTLSAFVSTLVSIMLFYPATLNGFECAINNPCFRTILGAVCGVVGFLFCMAFIFALTILVPILLPYIIKENFYRLKEKTVAVICVVISFCLGIFFGLKLIGIF